MGGPAERARRTAGAGWRGPNGGWESGRWLIGMCKLD